MRYVIIHDADHDGYASAWLMQRHLPQTETIETFAIRAGCDDVPSLGEGDHVYILDRSYPLETLLTMSRSVSSILVIDHHETFLNTIITAYKDTGCIFRQDSYNGSTCRIECGTDNLELLIDTRQSACCLTLDYCDKRAGRYSQMCSLSEGYDDFWFVKYIGDRDIWTWKLPMSREINAGLHTFPLELSTFDKLYHGDITIEQCEERGIGIVEYQNMLFSTMLSVTHTEEGSTYNKIIYKDGVVLSPCPFAPLISDYAAYLMEHTKADVALLFQEMIDDNATLRFSVRSKHPTHEIAKSYGGGGHPLANGFSCHLLTPQQVMESYIPRTYMLHNK